MPAMIRELIQGIAETSSECLRKTPVRRFGCKQSVPSGQVIREHLIRVVKLLRAHGGCLGVRRL